VLCDFGIPDGRWEFSSFTYVLPKYPTDGKLKLKDVAIYVEWVPSRWTYEDLPRAWKNRVRSIARKEKCLCRRLEFLNAAGQSFVDEHIRWKGKCELALTSFSSRLDVAYIIRWANTRVEFQDLNAESQFRILKTCVARGLTPE
jgi:hypothetical protein